MTKGKIGLYLLFFIAFALAATGVLKFLNPGEFAVQLNGNESAPLILGAVELLIAAAIVIPKSRLLGVILAASYWGGAIAVSWIFGEEVPAVAAGLNAITYVAAYLYRPSLGDGSATAVNA